MRPRVVILVDVHGWAWERKALQLQRHLADHFEIEIVYQFEGAAISPGRDLYHTFEVFQLRRLVEPGLPAVTGITAHVWPTWEREHGRGTVRRWAEPALAFHANSRLLEAEMLALLERPICYVPNGVDESFFRRLRPRAKSRRLVVGWVGKPNPRKGSHLVEEACRQVGAELRTVERRHTNALSAEEMREFYQDLHVLAVASDMDGTPNPALEAAACGVAIVANRIGNMPEFIADGENGQLVPRTADGIAGALRELGRDLDGVCRMGEAARATVEREWTWARQARAYGAMWLGALEGRARSAA